MAIGEISGELFARGYKSVLVYGDKLVEKPHLKLL